MKFLLASLGSVILLFSSYFGFLKYQDVHLQNESLDSQSQRLAPELWKIQKQFGVDQYLLTVHAVSAETMLKWCPEVCWGATDVQHADIYILRTQDMATSMPQELRVSFQNLILQHEVMHVVLTEIGVPGDAQDTIIRRLQPSLIKP